MDEDFPDEDEREDDALESDARSDERDDADLRRTINPRVDNMTELTLAMTKPTVDSKFSKTVSRDLSVGNIPRNQMEYVDIVRKYVSLINDFQALGLTGMAGMYNADLKALINTLRSVGGFERKQQTTATVRRIRSDEGEHKESKKWGL